MQSAYLTSLPQKFIRGMAGSKQQGNYYFCPSQSCLLSLVFPDVDWRMGQFLGMGEEVESDLAGQGFLRLLPELRTVFLQDSALLRKEFPEHSACKHALFALPEHKAFALAVVGSQHRAGGANGRAAPQRPSCRRRATGNVAAVCGKKGGLLGIPECQEPASHQG